ncbi:hypothetical protein D3C71_1631760 [compost metagenome]
MPGATKGEPLSLPMISLPDEEEVVARLRDCADTLPPSEIVNLPFAGMPTRMVEATFQCESAPRTLTSPEPSNAPT